MRCAVIFLASVGWWAWAQPLDLAAEHDREWKAIAAQIDLHRSKDPAVQQHIARLETEAQHRDSLILATDRDPLDVLLRRTQALWNFLGKPAATARQLADLRTRATASTQRRALFDEACNLRRSIAFANPLLNFDRLAFLTHHRAQYEHMCDQYYGFHAKPGGSVMVLNNPFSQSPSVQDLITSSVVSNGRLKGQKLEGGSFISMELSYDAKTIFFAWTPAARTVEKWTPESTYHLFKMDADGSNLVQLTDGPYNDFDPCQLPDGRIAFISERRGGYLRCGGPRANPVYTLYSMKSDGSDITPLSYHETHEWHPSVDHRGMLVYTRWDYVDRDSDVAHHIWSCYPDGRDPRSAHGNYPTRREDRPWMEMSIRAIPGSERFVAVAAPHHGQAYGSLVRIDVNVPDDNAMSQLKRITPDVAFPESEKIGKQCYGTPWPLSEDFYLCVYDAGAKHYGIYLVDSFGNRELIWRDDKIACLDPIPLRPRPTPPVLSAPAPITTDDQTGAIAIANVYESDPPWPADSRITSLRVIQVFPKETIDEDKPRIGVGRQSLVRGVLGTVPVEKDGSAHFTAPAGVPIYFQALDEKGLAVQTMRSVTYVHPGQKLTCIGCHESKWKSPPASDKPPIAWGRAPSRLTPEAEGSFPLSYPRLVQNVLDRRCVECHAKEKACDLSGAPAKGKFGWSRSAQSLIPFAWAKHGGNGAIKINGPERSIPGDVGARASKLYPLLTKGHYGVELSPEEMRRITLWLDCNSVFFGAYHDLDKQLSGETIMPRLR